MAYLSTHLTALDPGFGFSLSRNFEALLSLGRTALQAQMQAQGLLYKTLLGQAAVMGYLDAFLYSGVAALLVLPLAFLLRSGAGGRSARA
jgi:DHA2 family multidrug resistance protein